VTTRLEEIRQALFKADDEGRKEDARVLAEAYFAERAKEIAPLSGLQAEPLTLEQIKQRQAQAAKEGIAFREQQAAERETGIFENLVAGADVAATTMYQGAPVIAAGINSAIVGESGEYTGYYEDIDQDGNRILVPQSREEYDRIGAERKKLQERYAGEAAQAFKEGIVPISEAQRRYQDVNQRASGWLSRTVGDVGASSPSFIPAVAGITTATATGLLTRNPTTAAAAGKAAQVITSPIPAYQAAVNAYIQHKDKYPYAPESEHLAYATAQAGIELGSEMILPAAGAGKTLAGTVTKRVGSEVLSENISELGGNILDVAVAPELAPKSLDDVVEGHLRASSAALVGVAPVSVIGARDATLGENLWADLQSKKPPVAPPTPTGDPAIDAGQAAGEAIARSVADSLSLGTAKQGEIIFPEVEPTIKDLFTGEETPAPGNMTDTLQAQQVATLQADLATTETQRRAVQEKLSETMTRKERAALTKEATDLIAKENRIKQDLSYFLPRSEAPATALTDEQKKQAEIDAAFIRREVDTIAQKEAEQDYTQTKAQLERLYNDPRVQANQMSLALVSGKLDDLRRKGPPQNVKGKVAQPTIQDALPLAEPRQIKSTFAPAQQPQPAGLTTTLPLDLRTTEQRKEDQAKEVSAEVSKTKSDLATANKVLTNARQQVTDSVQRGEDFSDPEGHALLVEAAANAEANVRALSYKLSTLPTKAGATSAKPTRAQRATTPAVQQPTQTTTTDNQQDIADAERVFTTTDPKRQALESKIAALANGTTRTDRVALENEVRANLVTQQAEAPNDKRSAVRNAVLNLARKVDNAFAMLNVVKTIVNVQSKTKDKIADIPDGVDRIIASLENHPLLKGTKVIVGDDVDTLPPALAADIKKDGGDIAGAYLPSSDIIMLSGNIGTGMKKDLGGDVVTVIHEMLHGVSERAFILHDKGLLTDKELIDAIDHFDKVREAFNKRFNLGQTEQGHSTRKLLTTGESHAIDYANKSRSEFLAVALTSPEFRSAARKMNMLTKVKDAIRRLFRLPPTDQQILDDILDAGLKIVDLTRKGSETIQNDFNALKAQVNGGTVFNKEAPTRSERVKLREQTVGKAKKVEPGTNRITQSDTYKAAKDFLSALFSPFGREGAEGKRAMQIAKGTQLEIDAVSKRLSNALKNELYHIKATDKELAVIDQLAKTYLSGYKAEDRKAAINDPRLPAKLKPVLESARKEMDDLSVRVAAQITDAYSGKDMPESVINTLETLTENLGKYISRSYEIDYVKGFGKKLWRDYKAGEAKAIERLQPLMNLISNQVATLPDSLNKLGRTDKGNLVWKEKGRGRETVRDYLSRMHTNLIGSPAGLSNNDMFEALNALAKSPKMKNIQEMTDTIVKGVIDYHDVDNDSQVKFFRGLRSDDRALRKRVRVPEEFRKAWGEVDDPAINVVITLSRQAAALANLRASAYWEQASPDLFTDAQSDETPVRVPNDPFIYGRLAGKYTTKGVLATIKAQAAPDTALGLLNINNSVETGRYLGGLIVKAFTEASRIGKTANIVLNLKNLAMNLTNFIYVPLANGNLTYAHMGKGAKVAKELFGTAYQMGELSPEARELLGLGVIDPAQTQVDEDVRQLKKESQLRRSLLANPIGGFQNQLNTFREANQFLELTPKIANYFWNKEQLARLYPSLTESEVQEEAARLTNETNITYSYTPKAARMAETIGLSYVSSFIAESFRTTYANIAVGTRMLKNGDTPAIKLAGAQRLAGQALSLSMASLAAPALIKALSDSLLVLGGDDGEDEDKIFNALEYTESGNQRIVWNLRPDGSFDVFDLGMWSTYDVAYSPARAVADAMEAAYEGDYDRSLEGLQDALKASIGSFFQGAPLSKLALRSIKGGDVETDAWLSTFIPGFAKSIGRSTDLPEDASPQEQIFAVLNMPREERSFIEDLRGTTTGNFTRAVTESKDKLLSTLEGVPDGIRFVQSMSNAVLGERSAQYVPYKEEELVDLWGEVQDDQREAFEELMVKIEGARAINRMRGAPQDEGIQQALVDGGMSKKAAKQAVESGTYTPSPLSDSWGQREIDRAVRKETTRAAKAALRETLEKRRLQIIRITGGTVDDT